MKKTSFLALVIFTFNGAVAMTPPDQSEQSSIPKMERIPLSTKDVNEKIEKIEQRASSLCKSLKKGEIKFSWTKQELEHCQKKITDLGAKIEKITESGVRTRDISPESATKSISQLEENAYQWIEVADHAASVGQSIAEKIGSLIVTFGKKSGWCCNSDTVAVSPPIADEDWE